MSILETDGSLAGCLTSQITQLVIDTLSALINVGSLLDVSRQHGSVRLDLLNRMLHHALDRIVDLVDVLDLSLCGHQHFHAWLGSPLDVQRSACVLSEFSQNAPSGSASPWERATDFPDTSPFACSEPLWVETGVSCYWC